MKGEEVKKKITNQITKIIRRKKNIYIDIHGQFLHEAAEINVYRF